MKLRIEFSAAAHHGSGFGLSGVVDRGVLRDGTQRPYLAGSSLKGRFRHAARLILPAYDPPRTACETPLHPAVCKRPPWCLMCVVFGSAMHPGQVSFSDAFLDADDARWFEAARRSNISPVLEGGTEIRASTAIDRHTRTVRREHFFTTETLPPLVFVAEVEGTLPAEGERLLRDCAEVLTHFGAGGARGLGRCRYRFV
jgi:CRISPR/Cas system CSM-associated protein Csm3 (group 7 of RAMP superfamily)